MDTRLATLQTAAGRPVLRFERRFKHPPEKVWRAITDPAELEHWFPASIETELKPGAPMRFVFRGEDIDSPDGEVLEVDPPKVFAYRWGDSVMRWEVLPDGDGSRLVFSHTLGGEPPWGSRVEAARHAAGWDVCLESLGARLDGRSDGPPDGAWSERNELYVEEFGLAEGEVLGHPGGYLIRFERDVVRSAEEVWAELTGPGVAPGGPPPARLVTEHFAVDPIGDIEAPRILEFAWLHGGAPAGVIRWEFTVQDFACRIILTQTIPEPLADLRATALAVWQVQLEELIAALQGVRRPWPAGRVEALTRRYAERL